MISSLQLVNFSIPSFVTTQEFSIPTGPTPGMTILGSNAKTMPGSSSCFIRGAITGASLISSCFTTHTQDIPFYFPIDHTLTHLVMDLAQHLNHIKI